MVSYYVCFLNGLCAFVKDVSFKSIVLFWDSIDPC